MYTEKQKEHIESIPKILLTLHITESNPFEGISTHEKRIRNYIGKSYHQGRETTFKLPFNQDCVSTPNP